MRKLIMALAAAAVVAGTATARDIEFKPVDTQKLIIAPSKAVAGVAAGTIDVVGQAAAGAVEGNGYIKTINNLFSFKKEQPPMPTQPGYSALPAPGLFPSNYYKSYNTPVRPVMGTYRR